MYPRIFIDLIISLIGLLMCYLNIFPALMCFTIFYLLFFTFLSIKYKSFEIILFNIFFFTVIGITLYLLKMPIIRTVLILRCFIMLCTSIKEYISFKRTFSNRIVYKVSMTAYHLVIELDSSLDSRYPCCTEELRDAILPFVADLKSETKYWKASQVDINILAYRLISDACIFLLCSGKFHICHSIIDSYKSNHLWHIFVKCQDYLVKNNALSESAKEKNIDLVLKGIELAGSP